MGKADSVVESEVPSRELVRNSSFEGLDKEGRFLLTCDFALLLTVLRAYVALLLPLRHHGVGVRFEFVVVGSGSRRSGDIGFSWRTGLGVRIIA